jgi:hypothetical protein
VRATCPEPSNQRKEGQIQKPDEQSWQNGSNDDENDIDDAELSPGELCQFLCDGEHRRNGEHEWQKPKMRGK